MLRDSAHRLRYQVNLDNLDTENLQDFNGALISRCVIPYPLDL